jgi:hypothetical protein
MPFRLNAQEAERMNANKLYIVFWLTALLVLSACGEKEKGIGRYGMLDESTPEYTAVAFLNSVYEDDNLDRAISLSSEKMTRILKRYHTNRNVQRHLLNLKYDTVIVTPQTSGSLGRTEFAEKSTITVFLSGMYGDDKIEKLRSLDLIKEDGDWKINKIHPDTYL